MYCEVCGFSCNCNPEGDLYPLPIPINEEEDEFILKKAQDEEHLKHCKWWKEAAWEHAKVLRKAGELWSYENRLVNDNRYIEHVVNCDEYIEAINGARKMRHDAALMFGWESRTYDLRYLLNRWWESAHK